MILPELQLVYLHPTKTAGMAVENAFFRRFLGVDVYNGEHSDEIDRYYPHDSQHFGHAELVAVLPHVADWRKCVTVRHPYDRALSEFKFQRRDGRTQHREVNAAVRDGSLWSGPGALPYHDKPQADYLAPNAMILRCETLDDDWSLLSTVLGAKLPPLKKINVSHGGCGLTDESQAIIYERFKDDFVLLGYEP